ncbi:MAG: hypothetical protein RMJ88_16185 [Thermogemmata sp.]|nr:hypothetical protein [Thermogemmata sp.]
MMVTRYVTHPAICWPIEAVRDSQGVFRGFLMPRATGEPLGHGLFIPTVWLCRHPNWTRRDSVRLAISILEAINYIHRMNVLLGDINPMNILVKDANTVFLVDCDSYQVEGFPCPVGSVNFVAPEIQGQDFSRFLRTLEHELFAVATLLFMIMLPGKPPYSHQGGADGAANIKKMHFPYPLGEKAARGAPEGPWRFCWSHLTRPIKEAFYQVFHADSQGQPRVTVSTWLRLFREYERILAKPTEVFVGPTPQYGFDLSILPHNFRYVKGMGRPLPTGGETDLQRSVKKMVSASKQTLTSRRSSYTTHTSTCAKIAGTHQGSTYVSTPISTPSSSYPGVGEWYNSPLLWPLAAPFKALLEVAAIGIAGTIVGATAWGLLLIFIGQDYEVSNGAMGGAGIGTVIGMILAAETIKKVDSGIFVAGGIGILGGAITGGILAVSWEWAVAGAVFGMFIALFVRRLQIGERKAAEYMHTWWG